MEKGIINGWGWLVALASSSLLIVLFMYSTGLHALDSCGVIFMSEAAAGHRPLDPATLF